MKKVDIIVPVCGNLPIVKECLESLYPIPNNWKVIIYISKMSQIDGTTEYLVEKQKEFGFDIIDEGVTVLHGKAVAALLSKSTSPWVLHLDSDAKLLDKKFYSWAEEAISKEKFKVWGRVDGREPSPDLRKNLGVRLIRTQSWNVFFERKYVDKHNLSFSPITVEGIGEVKNINNKRLLIWGDTSWEYFWKASKDDLFGRYPDDVWACWEHKGHSTVNWKKSILAKQDNSQQNNL